MKKKEERTVSGQDILDQLQQKPHSVDEFVITIENAFQLLQRMYDYPIELFKSEEITALAEREIALDKEIKSIFQDIDMYFKQLATEHDDEATAKIRSSLIEDLAKKFNEYQELVAKKRPPKKH